MWWFCRVEQWQYTWLDVHYTFVRIEFPHTFEFLVDIDTSSIVVGSYGGSTTFAPSLHYPKLLSFECLDDDEVPLSS